MQVALLAADRESALCISCAGTDMASGIRGPSGASISGDGAWSGSGAAKGAGGLDHS